MASDPQLDGLLAEIARAPRDDPPRRVLADYLIDRNGPDDRAWGEMLALALESARAGDRELARKADQHAAVNAELWPRILDGLVHHVEWTPRGFHVALRWDMLDRLGEAIARLPIRSTKVLRSGRPLLDDAVRRVAGAAALAHVDRVELENVFSGPRDAGIARAFEPLMHLRELAVTHQHLNIEAMRAIGALPWRQLERLELTDSRLPRGGLAALLAGPGMTRLTTLVVNQRLDADDVRAIADAGHLTATSHLRIRPDAPSAIALSRATHLQLQRLELASPTMLEHILGAPAVTTVRSLRIDGDPGVDGARAIAAAALPALETLELHGASDSTIAMLAHLGVPTLRSLTVRIIAGDEAAHWIAESTLALTSLSLGNRVTDHGARVLGTMTGLARLDLTDNLALGAEIKRELRKRLGDGVCAFRR